MLIKDQNIVNANEEYLEKWISKLKLNFQKTDFTYLFDEFFNLI